MQSSPNRKTTPVQRDKARAVGAEIGRSINLAMSSGDVEREIARLSEIEARHVAEEYPAKDEVDWGFWGLFVFVQLLGGLLIFGVLLGGIVALLLLAALFATAATALLWVAPVVAAVAAVAWVVKRVNMMRRQSPAHAVLIPIVKTAARDVVRARGGLRA